MTSLSIVGGVYNEHCLWPAWDQIYGSGGRAACAVAGILVDDVTLFTTADPDIADRFAVTAENHGVRLVATRRTRSVSFDYVHPMSGPTIVPPVHRIERGDPIAVEARHVLRFGMIETTAKVSAEVCVYDPQSAFGAEPFTKNGSSARRLAIVANRRQVVELSGVEDPIEGARRMVDTGEAEVVVVKAGSRGATVIERSKADAHISAFRSERVWTIGSGDVFSAVFAAAWGVHGVDAPAAALRASHAVAQYADSMALPVRAFDQLSGADAVVLNPGLVYLASPFFTIAERWMVDEAVRCLKEVGMDVFSPVHEIGPGPASLVAPADLEALGRSDVVFAILDGLDSGTVFEVGHARALGKPVYAFSQQVTEEDLKMIEGSGCHVGSDFVTMLHQLAWRP